MAAKRSTAPPARLTDNCRDRPLVGAAKVIVQTLGPELLRRVEARRVAAKVAA